MFLWFLEWPAYAIAHGHNPFYSTALFHGSGINLLSNTSVLAVGTVLAPVTWLFGPVATLNVASTLAPVLSATAMFWLLLRWVRWRPAAFVGGLVFGFSPFLFVNVAGGHLMTSVLVLVPLIVGCLDELFIRQERRPAAVGAVLGALVVMEFFVSTEVLVIVVISAVLGTLLLVAFAALRDREQLSSRVPYAFRSLVAAAVVSLVVLAYPLWFALDGPSHLSGLIWPSLVPGAGGISIHDLWYDNTQTALRSLMQVVGGYEGPALPGAEYIGPGLLIVFLAGLIAFRREMKLWFFGVLAIVGVALSLDVENSYWVPWRILVHIPLVRSIIPTRFMIVTTLCLGVALALVVDSTHAWLSDQSFRRSGAHETRESDQGVVDFDPTARSLRVRALAPPLAGLLVAAVGIAPMAVAISSNVPVTVEKVELPEWFAQGAPLLPSHQVVLAYPAPFTLVQSAMAWQAVDSLHFAMAGGGGPGGVPSRAGKERAGLEVLAAASFSVLGPPAPSDANVSAVRHAIEGWGVTMVVVPDPTDLPRYDTGTDPALAIGLFTLAIGQTPRFVDDAWVWSDVGRPALRRSIASEAFLQCTISAAGPTELESIPGCVMNASRSADS